MYMYIYAYCRSAQAQSHSSSHNHRNLPTSLVRPMIVSDIIHDHDDNTVIQLLRSVQDSGQTVLSMYPYLLDTHL